MIHIKNKNTAREIIYKKSLKISKHVSIKNSYFDSPVSIGENSKIFNSNLKKYFICGNNNEITNSQFGSFCSIGNNITTIMIAHRLSSVKNCDIIFLLEKGELKQQGTFKELVKNNDLFNTDSYKN